jgi:hypothetical protein
MHQMALIPNRRGHPYYVSLLISIIATYVSGKGMNDIEAAGTIILFFALRCIAPLAITLGIGYLMNRLVDHWEAEEAMEEDVVIETPAPYIIKVDSISQKVPCWITRNCDEEKRSSCPAYLNQSLPCWIARLLYEGAKPASCADCQVYDPELSIS